MVTPGPVSVSELRDAASSAHRCGDTEAAIGFFQKILDLFPETPEAGEAVFYLTSIGKGARRHARRAVVEKKQNPQKSAAKS